MAYINPCRFITNSTSGQDRATSTPRSRAAAQARRPWKPAAADTAVARVIFRIARWLAAKPRGEMVKLRKRPARARANAFRTGIDTADGVTAASAELEAAVKTRSRRRGATRLPAEFARAPDGQGPDAGRACRAKAMSPPAAPALPRHLPWSFSPTVRTSPPQHLAEAPRSDSRRQADSCRSVDLRSWGLEASRTSTAIDDLAILSEPRRRLPYPIHLPLFQGGSLRGRLEAAARKMTGGRRLNERCSGGAAGRRQPGQPEGDGSETEASRPEARARQLELAARAWRSG